LQPSPDFEAGGRFGGKRLQLSIMWVAAEACGHAGGKRAEQLQLKVKLVYIRRPRK